VEDGREQFLFILGGTLTLLGLIIGLRVKTAIRRYDLRKQVGCVRLSWSSDTRSLKNGATLIRRKTKRAASIAWSERNGPSKRVAFHPTFKQRCLSPMCTIGLLVWAQKTAWSATDAVAMTTSIEGRHSALQLLMRWLDRVLR